MSCIFCQILNKVIQTDTIFENTQLIIFHDIKPQAPTHLLIVPKQHIATIDDIQSNHQALLGEMILAAKHQAQQFQLIAGYRLVLNVNHAGGQEINHIHLHLLGGRQLTWPPG